MFEKNIQTENESNKNFGCWWVSKYNFFFILIIKFDQIF